MFHKLVTKWVNPSQHEEGKRMSTSQSRDLSVSSMSIPPNPYLPELSGNNKTPVGIFNFQQPSKDMASPPNATDGSKPFIFKNSRSYPSEPFIVVKSTKRQRERLGPKNDGTMPEGSSDLKRRRTASQRLILPAVTGNTHITPNTTPDDTPKVQPDSSTFESFTPDPSIDPQHRRRTDSRSEAPTSSPTTRINQINILKIAIRPEATVPVPVGQAQPTPGPIASEKLAEEAVDRANDHRNMRDFHGAETEFLKAFEMYTRSKGLDSPQMFRSMDSLAEIYEDQTRPSEAPRRRRNCYVFCG